MGKAMWGIKPMLEGIKDAYVQTPSNVLRVTDIPGGRERLMKMIEEQQNRLLQVNEERQAFMQAMASATQQYNASMSENEVKRNTIQTCLYRLQGDLVDVVQRLGIIAEAIPPPGVTFRGNVTEGPRPDDEPTEEEYDYAANNHLPPTVALEPKK